MRPVPRKIVGLAGLRAKLCAQFDRNVPPINGGGLRKGFSPTHQRRGERRMKRVIMSGLLGLLITPVLSLTALAQAVTEEEAHAIGVDA